MIDLAIKPVTIPAFVERVFLTVDGLDAAGFVDFFCEDGMFRFANLPPIQGKAAIKSLVDAFFNGLKAVRHTDLECWRSEDTVIINGWVTYTRLNNSQLSVPFSVTFKLSGALIREYLIFIDNSAL